jgi:membrane fusion protein (multidrug efflux system)
MPSEKWNQFTQGDENMQSTLEQDTPKEIPAQVIETKEAPPARSKFKFIIGGVVLIAAIAGGYFYFSSLGEVSTDDAQVDGHIVTIAPKISGNVLQVLVNDNEHVKAGQALVTIDPRDYQARVDQLKAAVALAESQTRAAQVNVPMTAQTTQSMVSGAIAQLEGAKADYARAKALLEQASNSEISYAHSNVANKQANFDRAQSDLARMKSLIEKAEISQQQYDSYVAAAKMAESDLQAAKDRAVSAADSAQIAAASLESAKSKIAQANAVVDQSHAGRQQVAMRGAEVSANQAGIAQAEANLAAADLQLSYTRILAPYDGVVTRKTVEPGSIVQPGQGLMMIISDKDMWVTANFKETQLRDVRPGQRAEIKLDMYGHTVEGKVDSIATATGARLSLLPPENATGNYVKVVQRIPVKILVDRTILDKSPMSVGMNVEATIVTK